jgi:hypothetical protein
MASITISSPTGANVNPTSLQFPVNIGGEFVDSVLYTKNDQSAVYTTFPGLTGGTTGINLDSTNQVYKLGDFNNLKNNTAIVLDDINSKILLTGTNIVTTGGSHPPTTKHLNITIQGTQYVIQLLQY